MVRVKSRRFSVRLETEEVVAHVPKKFRHRFQEWVDPVGVGDRVVVEMGDRGPLVAEIHPRVNALARPASGRPGRRQLLAANLDHAVVVMSVAEPPLKTATVDRYLVLASSCGIPTLIVVNKMDLAQEPPTALAHYPGIGIPVRYTCALTGRGIDALAETLKDSTSVLIGPSGAGKSSLMNRLVPGADLRTGEVSAQTSKGRHTTTWVEMLDLPGGGHLVDSPGIRVLDLSGLEAHQLAAHFPEFKEPAQSCRFRDCSHTSEPRCEVQRLLAAGEISRERYGSYMSIYASLERGEG